ESVFENLKCQSLQLKTLVNVSKLCKSERRLDIGESQIGPDLTIEIGAAPLQISVVDESGGFFVHGFIGSNERTALSGCKNLRDAEGVCADVTKCPCFGSVIHLPESACSIFNEGNVILGTIVAQLKKVLPCIAREVDVADGSRLRATHAFNLTQRNSARVFLDIHKSRL